MAYQLSTHSKIIDQQAKPARPAGSDVFVYPQPSSLNYGDRPQTMLFGTAPYKAGKGAPAEYIETDDELRPQSTSRFGKVVAMPVEQHLHPVMDADVMRCKLPQRVPDQPSSSRADVQNVLFAQRYNGSK
jgi:hypothetical protein|tara:strand:- start:1028 stop:1417 length:390 start_codon:yes stop_codon:yes gene_type:complete